MRKTSHAVVQCSVAVFIGFAVAGCGGGGGGGASAVSVPVASTPTAPPTTTTPGPTIASIPNPASLSGPSILPGGVPGRFDAAELPIGTAVTVFVKDPTGAEQSFNAMVGDDGRLSYNVTAGAEGVHSIRMMDSAGRELASANFIAL